MNFRRNGTLALLLGKRKHTPPCSSEERFFAEKNGGHRRTFLVMDMAFLVFIVFMYLPPAWKVFFEARKVLHVIFFRWW